jgi:ADP-heptose:LPS heptosyltransferase
LHPGSGGAAKVWPADNFLRLVQQNKAIADRVIFLLGGDAEREACEKIQKALTHRMTVVNLCGRLGFHELAGVLGGAELYIGNDSGPSHLAAYCGTPAFIIFGPHSDPAIWAPRGPHVHICWVAGRSFVDSSSIPQVETAFLTFLRAVREDGMCCRSNIARILG